MGGQTIDYQSALLQINHACYMAYLPMPFATRARFVLANDGERDYSQSVAYGLDYEENAACENHQRFLQCFHRLSGVNRCVQAPGCRPRTGETPPGLRTVGRGKGRCLVLSAKARRII